MWRSSTVTQKKTFNLKCSNVYVVPIGEQDAGSGLIFTRIKMNLQ